MTKEQESIAEKIIQKHKDNDGVYKWIYFDESFQEYSQFKLIIAAALVEKSIIATHGDVTRLTESGWEFKGFENERKLLSKKETRQNNIEELTLSKLKFEQFPAKFWWLLLLISIVISILTTWINNQIQTSGNAEKKQQIEITTPK